MKIRAIITGTTGMVGEGVLQECLTHPDVEQILVINRRSNGVVHPRINEIVHTNFFDLSSLDEKLNGFNACFFCLGVSSIGLSEEEYYSLTYTLTMHFAEVLSAKNPDMIFCYISGAGTDSSENGRVMWARVKGKTENDLMKLPFRKVYAFRPAFLEPSRGAKNVHRFYRIFKFVTPLFRMLFPRYISTLRELALAMINSVVHGYEKPVLEVTDIRELAKRHQTDEKN